MVSEHSHAAPLGSGRDPRSQTCTSLLPKSSRRQFCCEKGVPWGTGLKVHRAALVEMQIQALLLECSLSPLELTGPGHQQGQRLPQLLPLPPGQVASCRPAQWLPQTPRPAPANRELGRSGPFASHPPWGFCRPPKAGAFWEKPGSQLSPSAASLEPWFSQASRSWLFYGGSDPSRSHSRMPFFLLLERPKQNSACSPSGARVVCGR